jgi:diadenosine tetraphosphatase ApaH/serine/threonine PP2A family protein phosphatase
VLRFVHGSMRGNRVGIYERTPDDELAELIEPPVALLGVGHTHVPMVRDLRGTRVVNCGAVGLPFDGIHDARFAWLEWRPAGWQVDIVRIPYDRNLTEQAFHTSGYLADGGVAVPLILEELRTARAHVGPWHRRYEARVASGEIAIDESVRRLLDECREAKLMATW